MDLTAGEMSEFLRQYLRGQRLRSPRKIPRKSFRTGLATRKEKETVLNDFLNGEYGFEVLISEPERFLEDELMISKYKGEIVGWCAFFIKGKKASIPAIVIKYKHRNSGVGGLLLGRTHALLLSRGVNRFKATGVMTSLFGRAGYKPTGNTERQDMKIKMKKHPRIRRHK